MFFRVSGRGSEMVKCSFPFSYGKSVGRVSGLIREVGLVTEIFSKVGQVTEIFSKVS